MWAAFSVLAGIVLMVLLLLLFLPQIAQAGRYLYDKVCQIFQQAQDAWRGKRD